MSTAESQPPLFLRSLYLERGEESPEFIESLTERWGAWWASFCDQLPVTPPAHSTEEEMHLLKEFGEQQRKLVAEMSGDAPWMFRLNAQPGFEELLQTEYEEGDQRLRLGVLLLTDAFRTLGKVTTRANLLANARPSLVHRLDRLAERDLELDAASALLLRLELDAFVAFDFMIRGKLESASSWARSASISGRNVEAALAEIYASFDNISEFGLDRRILLSTRAANVVDGLLDNPPEPTDALQDLFRAHS